MKKDSRIQARHIVADKLAEGFALDWGRRERFLESKEWAGYGDAFNSWEQAIWKWAGDGITPQQETQWRAYLVTNRKLFSPASNFATPASESDMENYLQGYILRRAFFLGGLRHRKECDPTWFKGFAFYFYLAAQLNDDVMFKELARLTKRKPSEAEGKRALRFWLRFLWIPGCFWAFTNNGISTLLSWSDNKSYSEGSIKNTISALKLWRPAKPLYWGLNRDNNLVPLR